VSGRCDFEGEGWNRNYQHDCNWTMNIALERRDWIYDMYLGLWYDRPPVGFSFHVPRELVVNQNYFHKPASIPEHVANWMHPSPPPGQYPYYGPVRMIGDESREEAIASLRAATGMSQDEAEALVISGYKSLHVHSATSNTFYAHYISHQGSYTEYFNLGSTPDFGVAETHLTPYGTNYTYSNRFEQIWAKIVLSNFWQQYGQYASYNQDGEVSVIEDDFPIGLGICPNKAGTLLAVVKAGAKSFFIWQAEDEVFTERRVSVAGAYEGHRASFEKVSGRYVLGYDRDKSGSLGVPHLADDFCGPRGILYGLWTDQFDGTLRKIDKILVNYTLNCKKQFPRTDENRCWIERQTGGLHQLESPFYVMISREHAQVKDNTDRLCRSQEGSYQFAYPLVSRRVR
jgi:hypothetical protein